MCKAETDISRVCHLVCLFVALDIQLAVDNQIHYSRSDG